MEEKIRLAVFGQKRLFREGGIEIVVKELCTRMAQNGCDITCYNRAGHHVSGAEYDKTIEYDGIRQKVVPTIEKKGLAAVSSSFFAALCSAFGRYDVVHIHAEGPAFFCWIPKLFGKRVICTIHGLDWAREKWKFGVGSKFIRQGEKNAVKYADEIIVLSKGVQKYFMETYGRETHFIPNGVNRPEVREAKLITDHFGLEKDSYILFLGRLVPEKGIRYLVEVFKDVKTDKKLVIAGGSSDTDSFMEELKELAKGDDRILFTGFVQGAMLDELYSNAYIYTLPSDLEGMPLSLLEAMSYGNCCLVSDIPECAEVVEDKALMAGFVLKNTLSDNGGVTRGVCKMDDQNNLTEVVETKNIVKTATGAEADGVAVNVNSLVSMNMWGLTPEFLDVLEEGFKEFFEKEVPSNPQRAEYLIPIFIGELLEQGKMSVKVLKTNDTWYGMTYHEDVAAVKDSFKKMLENGVYKADLFSDL